MAKDRKSSSPLIIHDPIAKTRTKKKKKKKDVTRQVFHVRNPNVTLIFTQSSTSEEHTPQKVGPAMVFPVVAASGLWLKFPWYVPFQPQPEISCQSWHLQWPSSLCLGEPGTGTGSLRGVNEKPAQAPSQGGRASFFCSIEKSGRIGEKHMETKNGREGVRPAGRVPTEDQDLMGTGTGTRRSEWEWGLSAVWERKKNTIAGMPVVGL